ncbi:MAG: HlyD family efflux transporter periplasmic adaptor subunit [Planctomycetota bacterium]
MNGIRKKRRGWGFLVFVAIALAAAGWYAYSGAGIGGDAAEALKGAPVERGSLRINVVERGNLKAAKSVKLINEIEGRTTILWLIEEGVAVQPGDVLCQLDTSSLEDRLVQQEISVQNVEAAKIKAEQSYEIQKSENQSAIDRAIREFEFAKQDLQKYLEGDWPQQKETANEEITLAEEERTRAEQDYAWSQKLAEKGFLEKLQLESDRLALKRAEIRLTQSKRDLVILEQYTHPRRLAELDADVVEKERELERTKLEATAKIVDFEANLRATQARYDLEASELQDIKDEIEKSVLTAPVAGMVVYAREDRGRFGQGEPIQAGTEVRERQEIITIPASEGMIVEASLHESVLDKVEVGMPCAITVDAIPDRTFPGQITFKAVLPDQNSWWANPDLRVYRVEVRVLELDEKMRPGMSCSLDILVEEIADTLHMPLQCVFLDGGDPVCFIVDGKIEKRPLRVGPNNGKWVQVLSGVEEGELVSLSRPPGMSLLPAPERETEMPEDFPLPPGMEGGLPGVGNGAAPNGTGANGGEGGLEGGARGRGREGTGPGAEGGGSPGEASSGEGGGAGAKREGG